MREIKFRAWIREGEWVEPDEMEQAYVMLYGDKLAFEEYEPINDLLAGVENLMQYTGLHDKNGKEIYEGDIVQYIDKGRLMESGVYQVVYKDGAFRPICELYHPAWPNGWSAEQTCKVIGNIYENPELLAKKKE